MVLDTVQIEEIRKTVYGHKFTITSLQESSGVSRVTWTKILKSSEPIDIQDKTYYSIQNTLKEFVVRHEEAIAEEEARPFNELYEYFSRVGLKNLKALSNIPDDTRLKIHDVIVGDLGHLQYLEFLQEQKKN